MHFNCRHGQGLCVQCGMLAVKEEPPDQLISEYSVPGLLDRFHRNSGKRPAMTSAPTLKSKIPWKSPVKKKSKYSDPSPKVVRSLAEAFHNSKPHAFSEVHSNPAIPNAESSHPFEQDEPDFGHISLESEEKQSDSIPNRCPASPKAKSSHSLEQDELHLEPISISSEGQQSDGELDDRPDSPVLGGSHAFEQDDLGCDLISVDSEWRVSDVEMDSTQVGPRPETSQASNQDELHCNDHSLVDIQEDDEENTGLIFRSRWPFSDPNRTEGWPAAKAVNKLLNPGDDAVCDSVPQLCSQNATFIVDGSKLQNPFDISGDDNGAYEKPSLTKQKIKVTDGKGHRAKQNEKFDYVLKKRYYKHLGTPKFRRIVYELVARDGRQHKYTMLQYFFSDNKPRKLEYTAHGNSKGGGIFMPRTKGVKEKIKELSKSLPPVKVVAKMQEEVGGSEHLTSISQTARNSEQVKNLKRQLPQAHRSRSGPSKRTNFNNMFKLSQQGDFVKSFELHGGQPRAFCATGQQLSDLHRNCIGPDTSVLQIDGTFSVGNFCLTCTSYRTNQFVNAKNHKNTLMPGPYMMHAQCCEEDYEFFA